jgi:hypothetical protein
LLKYITSSGHVTKVTEITNEKKLPLVFYVFFASVTSD